MIVSETLEKKRALLAEIEQTKKSLYHLHPLDQMQRERWEAQTRVENIKARYGTDKQKWQPHIRSTYHASMDTIDRVVAAVKDDQKERAEINAQLNDLQEQLAGLELQITVKELLPLQTAYDKLWESLANFKGLLAVREEELVIGQKENGTLARLTKEKEDLLADIAGGDSTDQTRLEALTADIAKEEEARANQEAINAKTKQEIAGLTRKVGTLQQEVVVAKQNYLDGLSTFLDQELEKAAGEYVKEAGTLAGAYSKVIALATILGQCGAQRKVFGPYGSRFEIPSFSLDVCTAQETPGRQGLLYKFNSADVQEKIDAETQRLCKLGINIPEGIPAPL
nr:hypothetical protein [uncultured Desulfobulbus sp.]